MTNKNREVSLAGAALRDYLDYSFEPRLYDLIEAWLMASHTTSEGIPLFRNFVAFPTLLMEQWVSTGKTQTMKVCERLVPKGKLASYMTGPVMRDLVDEGYTLFCDDFHKIDGMVATVLKSGYQTGISEHKKIYDRENKEWVNKDCDIYGPKMVSTNKPLPYEVVDRMLRLPTYGTAKKMPQVDPSDPMWGKAREDIATRVVGCWKDILSEYNRFNATAGKTKLIGREIELWKPLIAISRATGLGVESLAEDMVKDTRARKSGESPEYMLLAWLEKEIAKPDYKSGYRYLSNDMDNGVRSMLDSAQLSFWDGTQPGNVLARLLPYPQGFKRFKATDKGRLYYTDKDTIRKAREVRPL